MTYCLRAGIAAESVLRDQVWTLPPATLVSIGHGLAMVPVVDEIIEMMGSGDSVVPGFLDLPEELDEGRPIPAPGSPISRALRRLGVDKATHVDEFDAVGLGRFRDTAGWLTLAVSG